MLNVYLLTYFTKKLNLVIIESNNSITQKYGEYLNSIFKEVTIYNCQNDFLSNIKESCADILLFDDEIYDKESTFSFIKDVHIINPLIKVIIFSKYIDIPVLIKCFKYNVAGFMYLESNEQDLKDFLKISVKRILMNNNNKFNENHNKFDVMDCLNFLLNEHKFINLVNHYKGIPIIRTAEILNYDEEHISLKIDPIQIKTIKKDEHVVISSMHLGVEILTSAKSINYQVNEITLKYNSLIDSYVHHRKNPRVEPLGNSNIIIGSHNHGIKVNIMNISVDHALCNVKKLDFDLKIHSTVTIIIDCYLDNKSTSKLDSLIKTTAFVKEILSTQDGEKILLQFKLNGKDYLFLDKYIEDRIKDLMKELKNKTFLISS